MITNKKTFNFILCITLFALFTSQNLFAQKTISVEQFNKVIISPHVQATFTKGENESITIESCTVNSDKVKIESNGKVLRVYLEGAKEMTKNEKIYDESGLRRKEAIYKGTVLKVAITYKTLEDLSVRGEETILLKSKLDQDNFYLNIYGESKIYFDTVQLKKLRTTIYGESYLELKSGNVTDQKFTAYGESKVNALGITNKISRATLYGESELSLNVSDQINVTAFGEAKIGYKGNPQIKKGVTIGKVQIHKLD